MKVGDLQVEGKIPFFRITDLGDEQQVKTSSPSGGCRCTPSLLDFAKRREEASGKDGWLFEGLRSNRRGDRGDAWGRWFGHQLRDLGINTDGRKVFHSLRHTFIARCREAEIEEKVRFALTGHSDGGSVGRSYGADESGYKFSLARLQREIAKVHYPGLDLGHLHQDNPG